jgi:hypothetical protein
MAMRAVILVHELHLRPGTINSQASQKLLKELHRATVELEFRVIRVKVLKREV